MKEIIHMYFGPSLDGLFFGFGLLLVYVAAVAGSALVRTLGGAGSKGMSFVGKFALGWFEYVRGDDRNTVNATLYTTVNNKYEFDTLIADRRIWLVWTNAYRMHLIKRAAMHCTAANPVILLNGDRPHKHTFEDWCLKKLAGNRIREDDYRAMYAPLISLISEQCAHDGAIDLALKQRTMECYNFVVALTFEPPAPNRSRRIRALVIHEDELLGLESSKLSLSEHQQLRHQTLLSIAGQFRANPERFGILKIWRPK